MRLVVKHKVKFKVWRNFRYLKSVFEKESTTLQVAWWLEQIFLLCSYLIVRSLGRLIFFFGVIVINFILAVHNCTGPNSRIHLHLLFGCSLYGSHYNCSMIVRCAESHCVPIFKGDVVCWFFMLYILHYTNVCLSL